MVLFGRFVTAPANDSIERASLDHVKRIADAKCDAGYGAAAAAAAAAGRRYISESLSDSSLSKPDNI